MIDELGFDKFGRANWHNLWMTMSFLVSQKSLDPRTKHGCIVVDEENTFLSMGYNSPPRKCVENNMPTKGDDKYKVFQHSESNAITNAARKGISLKDSIFYITGHPCTDCFGKMINVGVSKIIYGPVGSHMLTEEDIKLIKKMLVKQKIEIIKYEDQYKIEDVQELLLNTINYIDDIKKRRHLING